MPEETFITCTRQSWNTTDRKQKQDSGRGVGNMNTRRERGDQRFDLLKVKHLEDTDSQTGEKEGGLGGRKPEYEERLKRRNEEQREAHSCS